MKNAPSELFPVVDEGLASNWPTGSGQSSSVKKVYSLRTPRDVTRSLGQQREQCGL